MTLLLIYRQGRDIVAHQRPTEATGAWVYFAKKNGARENILWPRLFLYQLFQLFSKCDTLNIARSQKSRTAIHAD